MVDEFLIQITFDVMSVRKPLLSTSALKRRSVKIMFNHDYDNHFEERERVSLITIVMLTYTSFWRMESSWCRQTRCQEASAGDPRAIARADQAGQLDISGEKRTARHYAMRFQAQEEDSVERAAPRRLGI